MSPTPQRIALTFDTEHGDRPSRPGNEVALLDTLAAAAAPATFFVQGRWAQANPQPARRIVEDGHVLGSHAHHHVRMPWLTREGLDREIADAAAALVAATGQDGRPWFRNPFGAGAGHAAVRAAIEAAGYRHVGWHTDPSDWDPANSPDHVVASVVTETAALGAEVVVLLHAWPDATLAAMPELIGRLRERGAELVTIADLDELPDLPPWTESAPAA